MPRRPQPRTLLPTDGVSPLFQAALEATEEAVYNSLLKATTVTSRSGKAEAIPVDRVREILGRYPQAIRRLDRPVPSPISFALSMKAVVVPSPFRSLAWLSA